MGMYIGGSPEDIMSCERFNFYRTFAEKTLGVPYSYPNARPTEEGAVSFDLEYNKNLKVWEAFLIVRRYFFFGLIPWDKKICVMRFTVTEGVLSCKVFIPYHAERAIMVLSDCKPGHLARIDHVGVLF